MNKVEQAKAVLKEAGYHTDSLWHINDVTNKFECTDEQAYELLDNVINGLISNANETIMDQGMMEGFTEAEEEETCRNGVLISECKCC